MQLIALARPNGPTERVQNPSFSRHPGLSRGTLPIPGNPHRNEPSTDCGDRQNISDGSSVFLLPKIGGSWNWIYTVDIFDGTALVSI